MQGKSESILRAINNNTKKYNILTAPTHFRYQSNLSKLPHTFYLLQKEGFVKWHPEREPCPSNHILLDGFDSQIKPDIKIDLVFAQQIFNQLQTLQPIAQHINAPLVRVEHTTPTGWPDKQIDALKQLRGNINVFISKWSVGAWHFDENDPTVRIIEHCVDSEVFKPDNSIKKNGAVLNVANDFQNRGFILGADIFQRVVNGLNVTLVGDTPGWSLPAKNREELVKKYQECSVFLNCTRLSPIPTVVLEAMSCGTPVVSTATCAIPDIIIDGENGFCSNDEKYLRDRVEWCLKFPDKAREIGERGRQTILNRFSVEKHLNGWNKVFDELYGKSYE